MSQTIIQLNDYIDEGYTLPEILDTATKTLVIDWFGDRSLIKETFDKYFERSCNVHYPYYEQMLRIDPTVSKYDWFVDNYLERQVKGTDTGTTTTTAAGTVNRKQTTTGTDSGTTTTTGAQTTSGTTTSSDSGTTTDTTANSTAAEHVERAEPMSAEYTTTATAGTLTAGEVSISDLKGGMISPEILNPSGTAQDRTQGLTGNTGTSSNSGSTTNSQTVNDNNTVTNDIERTGTNQDDTNTSDNSSTTNDSDHLTQEIATGRNEDLPTLIDKARITISHSMAWFWLYHELDKCFLCVYDDYEEE